MEAWLLQRVAEELAEGTSEVELAVVFEMMDEVAQGAAAFISGIGEIVGGGMLLAVRADEGVRGICGERFGALLAVGWGNGTELEDTVWAEPLLGVDCGQRLRARGALQWEM